LSFFLYFFFFPPWQEPVVAAAAAAASGVFFFPAICCSGRLKADYRDGKERKDDAHVVEAKRFDFFAPAILFLYFNRQ
jgi:hypothetical protein